MLLIYNLFILDLKRPFNLYQPSSVDITVERTIKNAPDLHHDLGKKSGSCIARI